MDNTNLLFSNPNPNPNPNFENNGNNYKKIWIKKRKINNVKGLCAPHEYLRLRH